MTWNFDDVIKGQVAQTALHAAFERSGYRVRRLGVEELLPELSSEAGVAWRRSLPERLRFLPDLVVIDPDGDGGFLVEVKFRSRLSEELFRSLCSEIFNRRRFWPETVTVLMVAEPERGQGYHQDHIRVIPGTIGETELFDGRPLQARWENLPQLQHVFQRVHGSFDRQQVFDAITPLIRAVAATPRPLTLGEIQALSDESE